MGKVTKIETSEVLPKIDGALVKRAIKEITDAGQEATTAYLRLADKIAKWHRDKHWNEIERILVTEKIVSDSVLKKLILIGSNPVLMDQSHWSKLPIGYNHLYPFTQIAPEKLTELIDDGRIHNGLSVKESNELKDKFRHKKEPAPRTPKTVQFKITIKASANTNNVQSLVKKQFSSLRNHVLKLDKSASIELS